MDRPNDTTTHTEPPEQPGTTRANCFVTTHWSVVLSAQEKNSSHAAKALETLCRMPQRGLPDRLAGTWPVPR